MPPQVNARLVKIGAIAPDSGDDWDRPAPAGAGADKWTGSLEAYYREAVRRTTAGGELNVYVARTVWVDTASLDVALGEAETALDTDDVVTLELDTGATVQSPAKTIARSSLAGAEAVATVRIDLEDA